MVQDGADKLTTTRVTDRAGVSVGTLYQYCPNKAAPTEAVRAAYFNLISQAVGAALSGHEGFGGDKLTIAIAAVIDVKRDNRAQSLALAKLPGAAERGDFARDVVRHFAGCLAMIVSNGAPPTDARVAQAQMLVAAIEGALTHAVKAAPDWLHQDWFADHLQSLALAGVAQIEAA